MKKTTRFIAALLTAALFLPAAAPMPASGAFAPLDAGQYTVSRAAAPGRPAKEEWMEPYQFFLNYDAQEYRLTLDGYYDIQEVVVRFAPGKASDYLVQFAESDLAWYNAKPLSREQNGDTVALRVDECYRKYIRVQLNGPGASPNDVVDMQVAATPTAVLPAARKGPVTQGVARPVIMPLPESVPGVAQAVVDLSGTWKLNLDPANGFWRDIDTSGWKDAQVPAFTEVAAGEGVPAEVNDIREVAYKTTFTVPEDARGKKVFLRFESVQTTARVWVNGTLAGTHHGGYGTFDFDITACAAPGEEAALTVGAARVPYDPSFVLGHASDTLGINGPVKLIIAEPVHLTRLAVDTKLWLFNQIAVLKLDSAAALGDAGAAEARLTLLDPDGNAVALQTDTISYSDGGDVKTRVIVPYPKLWSAETPRLYTLTAELLADGEVVETVTRRVGFRDVRVGLGLLGGLGRELRVNGRPVFLRGVNWTNLNPNGGLTFDYESDRESLLLLKKANVNMIRTSHHPQYEAILDLCDEIGLYVEAEAGPHLVADGHVHTWIEKYYTLFEEKYLPWLTTLYAENVERSRSHASVIYYSAGNESAFGDNPAAGVRYIRAADPSRPVKFSWVYSIESKLATDFTSIHYGEPPFLFLKVALIDEYTHLLIGGSQLEADPGLRGFYASAIEKNVNLLWSRCSVAGCAIWQSRDFLVYGPGGVMPFVPEWGLLDPWNRPKPEYYDVKKAYAPVKLDEHQTVAAPKDGKLSFQVENRYAFTYLDEILCRWSAGGESGEFAMPRVAPGRRGKFTLPERDWNNGDIVTFSFVRPKHEAEPDYVVDTVQFTIGGTKAPAYQGPQGPAPAITEDAASITLAGDGFSLVFSKATGKITSGVFRGETLLCGGPELNLGVNAAPGDWTLGSITAAASGAEAVVTISGAYTHAGNVMFTLRVDGAGRVNAGCDFTMPGGDANEIGVAFTMAGADRIRWERRPDMWSWFPEDSISRLAGTAYRLRPETQPDVYGEKPSWAWKDTTRQYRPSIGGDYGATYDFRAAKRNVYTADILLGHYGLRAEMDGTGSVRASASADGTAVFRVNGVWSTPAPAQWTDGTTYNVPMPVKAGQRVSESLVLRFIADQD